MQKYFKKSSIFLLLAVLVISACTPAQSPAPTADNRDILYQVSTINALTAGNYDGNITIADLSKKGDFGLGTFEGVDGEMVMLDGVVYQVKDSGKVLVPDASAKLPFAAVTYFDADIANDVSQIQNYDGLKAALDKMIVKKDRFYAIRIDGVFDKIKVRSEAKQQKPYPILSEVLKNQSVFDLQNVKGTLVGFWCPDDIGTINAQGYHLHFISDDHTQGGHVLEISFANKVSVKLDETRFFDMELAENNSLSVNSKDAQGEVNKVEK